jgi:hypothetical protein
MSIKLSILATAPSPSQYTTLEQVLASLSQPPQLHAIEPQMPLKDDGVHHLHGLQEAIPPQGNRKLWRKQSEFVLSRLEDSLGWNRQQIRLPRLMLEKTASVGPTDHLRSEQGKRV